MEFDNSIDGLQDELLQSDSQVSERKKNQTMKSIQAQGSLGVTTRTYGDNQDTFKPDDAIYDTDRTASHGVEKTVGIQRERNYTYKTIKSEAASLDNELGGDMSTIKDRNESKDTDLAALKIHSNHKATSERQKQQDQGSSSQYLSAAEATVIESEEKQFGFGLFRLPKKLDESVIAILKEIEERQADDPRQNQSHLPDKRMTSISFTKDLESRRATPVQLKS